MRGRGCWATSWSVLWGRIPADQLLVAFIDDLQRDPQALYRRIIAFLSLEWGEIENTDQAKSSRPHRYSMLYQSVAPMLGPLVRSIDKLLRCNKLVQGMVRGPLVRDMKRDGLSAEPHAFFDPQIAKIKALTGRDLSHWKVSAQGGYDPVVPTTLPRPFRQNGALFS